MNNQIFGLKFRQLRKQQHITLAKAAAGITSRQSLGNWEIGKGELAFEKVLLQLMLATKLINYCIMLLSILT